MSTALAEAKQRLASKLDHADPSGLEPSSADPWIITSLLQKAIRRGEAEIAKRAANTLFALKGSAIWRRYMIIAFEDVGVGSIDAIVAAVAASSDADFRKQCGGGARVAIALAGLLAEAAKDRSADHLVSAWDHPSMSTIWQAMAGTSAETRLSNVFDSDLPVTVRAMATRSLCGLSPGQRLPTLRSQLTSLLTAFSDKGVPDELIAATEIAALRTREPITVMIPLLWLLANNGQVLSIEDCPVPSSPIVRDIPLYALDMHTRLGGEAIRRLMRENDAVRSCLEQYVPQKRWREAAYVAAFHVDAAPIRRRLIWDQSWQVEQFGVERDLAFGGVKPEGVEPLMEAVRNNLDHLNLLRSEALLRSSVSSPQSKSLKGIEGGIGLLPDGSLNIWVPGTPPSRWFKARSQTGKPVYIRIDYNVDGQPKYPVELAKFQIEAEDKEMCAKEPTEWIRNGVYWQRKSAD